jgi:hypothetical protein
LDNSPSVTGFVSPALSTGNVVLSMMVERCVKVPVMCEPALPFMNSHAPGVPQRDLDSAIDRSRITPLLAYRFSEDKICPRRRFVTLRAKFPAEGLKAREIPSGPSSHYGIPKNAHSVRTGEYPAQEDPNYPVQHVLDDILMQFSQYLSKTDRATRIGVLSPYYSAAGNWVVMELS